MQHNMLTRSLIVAGGIALMGLAVGPTQANAQTVPTVPTPCVDCDNADSGIPGNPGLSFAAGFACEPATGYGTHTATAHVPKGWAGPVSFAFPAATPGVVIVAPGHTATMVIRAPSGVDVFWVGRITGPGVARNVNRGPFTCDCPQPATTTTVVTSSSVPPTPPTSAPGGSWGTTHPGADITLPATGTTTDAVAWWAVVALAVGAFLLYASRKFNGGER